MNTNQCQYNKEHKNELNHQAYIDVFECKDPSYPNNEDYMNSYSFWLDISNRSNNLK